MKISKTLARVGAAVSSAYGTLALASGTFAATATSYIDGVADAGGGDLIGFIKDALNLTISLAALIAVGILIYSGIQYIVASGDEGKIEKATKGITYAVVGLIIAFISVLIVNFVLTSLLGQ